MWFITISCTKCPILDWNMRYSSDNNLMSYGCSASDWKVPTTFIYGVQDWMDYKGAQEARKQMNVPCEIIRAPQVSISPLINTQLCICSRNFFPFTCIFKTRSGSSVITGTSFCIITGWSLCIHRQPTCFPFGNTLCLPQVFLTGPR